MCLACRNSNSRLRERINPALLIKMGHRLISLFKKCKPGPLYSSWFRHLTGNTTALKFIYEKYDQTQISIWSSLISKRAVLHIQRGHRGFVQRAWNMSGHFTRNYLQWDTTGSHKREVMGGTITWGVPQTELNPLRVDFKTGCVVFKHCRHVVLKIRNLFQLGLYS